MNPEINKIIIETLLPFDPIQISVFGSYARGEMNDDSDIDILLDVDYNLSLLDLGGAYMDLKEKLNRKIDLVLKCGIRTSFGRYIEKDLIEIYPND
ncbi:nucleotidyltransferase family protein [Aequorivita capsosiphonis]|uniref:nucleotidyltransferase family protein n=1 Tax=Aequorivita capsosiphonis TaxID=487317 RepID=UPI0003FC0F4A|nr:nucleotidyltransferase domain-containing protein [Aequorivita capsosiphonis]